MKITEITKNKGTRYTVYVDGEYYYIFDIEIISQYNLKEGMECDAEFLGQLKDSAQRRKAKERALYLLEYRDHSYSELVKKLEKSVDEDIAYETADKMVELGFLNDERYCKRLCQSYFTVKKWGQYRVKSELYKKGFDKELIEQSIADVLEDVDIYDTIKQLIESKYYKYLTDIKGVKKATDALVRLGHSYSDIKDVINEYISDNDIDF